MCMGKTAARPKVNIINHCFRSVRSQGLDYQTFSPWETGAEIRAAVEDLKDRFAHILLIANSIGAYFSMNAGIDSMIQKAYFISPIVDMEKLITDMMHWAGITEEELKSKGMIHTAFGEDLSWDYLCYVRNHPVDWTAPTQILYGSRDNLTSYAAISGFAEKHNAGLTVMDSGEHWFHTEDQMRFLDEWILREEHKSPFPLKNENEDAGNTLSIPHKDFHNDLIIPRNQLLIIFYPDRKFSFSRQSITQTPSDW